MKRIATLLLGLISVMTASATTFPKVTEKEHTGYFALATADGATAIYTDAGDYKVVGIAAGMLADDVERVTGKRPLLQTTKQLPRL